MPRDVAEILNRRSDLSTFVVHLTKATTDATAHENLVSILATRTIEARSPMGWKGRLGAADMACLKVVCFSETPLEHTYTLFQDIAGRDIHLSTYGVAFTRDVARRYGAVVQEFAWTASFAASSRSNGMLMMN